MTFERVVANINSRKLRVFNLICEVDRIIDLDKAHRLCHLFFSSLPRLYNRKKCLTLLSQALTATLNFFPPSSSLLPVKLCLRTWLGQMGNASYCTYQKVKLVPKLHNWLQFSRLLLYIWLDLCPVEWMTTTLYYWDKQKSDVEVFKAV